MATDDPTPGVAESDHPFAGKPKDMEARVAALEAHVTHIQGDVAEIKRDLKDLRVDARGDFRILFGAIIAAALGLAGLMAKGFGWA